MAWWDRDWLDWSGSDPSGKDLLDWSGIDPTTTENQIDLTNIDINPFDAGEFLEVDLVESSEIIADAIAEDPIGGGQGVIIDRNSRNPVMLLTGFI